MTSREKTKLITNKNARGLLILGKRKFCRKVISSTTWLSCDLNTHSKHLVYDLTRIISGGWVMGSTYMVGKREREVNDNAYNANINK